MVLVVGMKNRLNIRNIIKEDEHAKWLNGVYIWSWQFEKLFM